MGSRMKIVNIGNAVHKENYSRIRLGILGGGQLARMMALTCHELSILPAIFSELEDDPAAFVSSEHFQGDKTNPQHLSEFLEKCDVVTFESEFLDGKLLAELSQKTNTPIYPNPLTMETLQDRASQKKLLFENKIPTAKSLEINNINELRQAFEILGKDLVLKKRRFGYDGYGTYFVSQKDNDEKLNEILTDNAFGFIAESKIKFKREMAILLARDQHKNIICFPLVESKQTQARCDWVKGPETHVQTKKLVEKLKKLLVKINYVGVIAFELFDTGHELLINEIAPRVHNSGHYSQNALSVDQFQTHAMAVCGFMISEPKLLSKGFAMANLLGQSSQPVALPKNLNVKFQAHLHWYCKKQNRAGRKMGHLNTTAKSAKEALKQALSARKKVIL
jgi:5-(carboxyamino)imidazole ribonucleotide synthase